MKKLSFLAVLAVLQGVAVASDPDPLLSTCHPWDETQTPFVTPGQCSSVDTVIVSVLDSDGQPISGAEVVIDLSGCSGVRVYNPASLVDTTDEFGIAEFNPDAGGCNLNCDVKVLANDVEICSYTRCVSTDWDGSRASDGAVDGLDLTFFAIAFAGGQDACADYDGDGLVGGLDLTIFAISFSCPDVHIEQPGRMR